MNHLILFFLLLGNLSTQIKADCQLTTDDHNQQALSCSDISGGDELSKVFSSLEVSYLSSVDIHNSPGLTDLPPVTFGDVGIGALRFYATGLVYLSSNSISTETAKELHTLYIKFNSEFSSFDGSILQKLTALENLYVSHNQVPSLDGEAASEKIIYFDFNYNRIASISPHYFGSAKKLSALLLNFNRLTTDSLVANSLTFNSTSDDIYVSLGWNKLKNGVHLKAFGDQIPKELILSGNDIAKLTEDTFAPLLEAMHRTHGDKAYLLLDHNDLDCSCEAKWILEHPNKSLIKKASCKDGRLLQTLTMVDFANC
ncbi:uncharacterized protein LOC143034533 [Oratosquilla oratoria]|uniref:uncharacterized protein LOC143034533 n=1 Tax=Oratosquilla oratoria TaxID=337810 RepID=UPI003F764A18